MTPPRHLRLDQQAVLGSCTTDVLADGSITPIKLNTGVFGSGVIPNPTTNAIDINVDNVTLELNLDVLRIKSVTPSQININSDLDFHNNQAVNFCLENVTSNPTPGNPGRIVWRTDLNEIRIDNGTVYIPIGGHTIEDEEVSLPQRAILNFVGSGVTVTDTGTKTQVDIVGETSTYAKDLFIVTNPADKILPLLHIPMPNSEIVGWNGLLLRPGVLNDYVLTGSTVTLNAGISLTVGDELMVVYAY